VSSPCEVFFGTQLVYVFLRLHHTLYVRLRTAWLLAKENALEKKNQHDCGEAVEAETASSIFAQFFSATMALAEGAQDTNKFEDFARTLLGNKSYVVFTLDKIISQLVKHLQAMANDENVSKLVGLFVYHRNQREGDAKGVDVELYRNHVAQILANTAEDVFRIQVSLNFDGCCVTS
jgi:paired amphipathic helix protein Sin3a